MKKNTIPFALLLAVSLMFSSCRQTEHPVSDNLFKLDNDRIGFSKPAGCYEIPELLPLLKQVNPNLLYSFLLDSVQYHSQLISVTRYAGDTLDPMEIVFIENTVKHTGEFMGCESQLSDFGVFDKHGKRYRYKVVKVDNDCFKQKFSTSSADDFRTDDTYKIMYYFMKNDLDSVLYELSIITPKLHFAESDSLILNLAESFKIYD